MKYAARLNDKGQLVSAEFRAPAATVQLRQPRCTFRGIVLLPDAVASVSVAIRSNGDVKSHDE